MNFVELVDLKELHALCESFTGVTGAVTAIVDFEGNILVQTGWYDICTCFHFVHPVTRRYCREDAVTATNRLLKGETYHTYKCRNGLIDVVVPIIVGGEHVANFFTGQFLFEPPDEDFFVRQAETYGFDKKAYIEALRKVPIFSEQQVRNMMAFFTRLARLMGEMGLARKRLEETNAELRKHQEHLEELVQEKTAAFVEAKEEAERANRTKSVFLANMSHELRTPLNAVLGFSQVMKNAADITAEQRENLDIITRSGEHLLSLINNVLDISKIESGRVELEVTHLDLFQLMLEMKSLMALRAREKDLDFTLKQSPDLPRHISVDGVKLRQVLINLIGNAIQYTTQGGVILRAMAAQKDSPGQVRVRFEVEDTGPGIPQEERERIFSPFVQLADRPPTEAGTGLGLAISKQYVELMGGRIGITGEPDRGSVFYFEIPVKVLPHEAAAAKPRRGRVSGLAEGQPRYRLLIADDNPDSRLLLRRLLEPIGFDLREAANGQEAVALFEQWHPHLIWMDIRMPVMDGLEATRQIKASDAGARAMIVAVTAHALEKERNEILAAGCDGFIRKPYQDTDIHDALVGYLGVHFTYEEEPLYTAEAAALDPKVLAELPGELLGRLEQALVRLDIGAVSSAIEAIRAHHSPMASSLEAVANDFQFHRMLEIIRAAAGGTDPENRHA